jgi:lipoprotein NlpI
MRAFFLAASAAALTATLPASAQVVIIGGSLARSCYLSAAAEQATRESLRECDRALAEEALTSADRLATHVNRGILRRLDGNIAGAQADFAAAMAINPNQPEPYFNLGVVHLNQGNTRSAVEMFSRAIELGTALPAAAYYGRGLANEDSGNIRAAYADLKRAAALEPEWDEPVRELARYQVRTR